MPGKLATDADNLVGCQPGYFRNRLRTVLFDSHFSEILKIATVGLYELSIVQILPENDICQPHGQYTFCARFYWQPFVSICSR